MSFEWIDKDGYDTVTFNVVRKQYLDGDRYGSHTGANDAANLADSEKAWADDSLIGLFVSNQTSGAKGEIADNDATHIAATLSGGDSGDNDWDTGDEYIVSAAQPDTHNGEINDYLLYKECLAEKASIGYDPLGTYGKQDSENPEMFVYGMRFDVAYGTMDAGQKTAAENVIAGHDGIQSTQEKQTWKEWGEDTNDTNTWKTAMNIETNPLTIGTWQFECFGEKKLDDESGPNAACDVRIIAEKLGGSELERYVLEGDGPERWKTFGRTFDFEADEADKWEIKIQFRKVGSDDATARVRRIGGTLLWTGPVSE